jgi:hypothetical protein
MQRILIYFLVISGVAAASLIVRGADGVTAHNVAVAIPLTLLFAGLVWLRWDIAPRIAKQRRERNEANTQDHG